MSRHQREVSETPVWYQLVASVLSSKRGILIALFGLLFVYTIISLLSPPSFKGVSKPFENPKREAGQEHHEKEEHRLIAKSEVSDNKNSDIEEEFKRRRELYEQTCIPGRVGRVSELFLHPPSKLSVCHVQKAGCTFWKRLFRYLYDDHGEKEVNSLFDIDRVLVHFGGAKTFKTYNYKSSTGRLLADAGTKVMIARDPYSRLWAAYVDKFVLPDSWLDHGRSMMFSRKTPSSRKACADNIQFEEFLSYTFRNYDDHWKPISDICDPCTYKPKYVGHMETFSRDVKYILETRSLGNLLQNHNHTKHMQDEIGLLIDYHYQLYQRRKSLHSCLTSGQLASRLWKAFQINGYFKMDAAFPEDEIEKAIEGLDLVKTQDTVIQIFLKHLALHPVTKEEWKAQRETNMVEAYWKIPKALKNRIAQRFQLDFKMFGYDPVPPDDRKVNIN